MAKIDKYGSQRESLKLKPEQWAALTQLAEATGSLTPFAVAGQLTPSWRTMIGRIADGELVIVPAAEVGNG